MGKKGYCVDPLRLHKKRIFKSIVSISSNLEGACGLKKGEKICTNCFQRLVKLKDNPVPGPSQTSCSTNSDDGTEELIPVASSQSSSEEEPRKLTLQEVLPMLDETPIKLRHNDNRGSFRKDVDLDTSLGLTGIFYQISQAFCKPSSSAKSRDICLAYINYAVNILKKNFKRESDNTNGHITLSEKIVQDKNTNNCIMEDWNNNIVKEKYFCLFRCALLHKRKEVRVATLRLLRYVIKTEDDVICLIKSNSIPLITRCIDISIDNHNERVHGMRLARHIMQVAPFAFPSLLARSLIAIAKDGSKDRDKLLRSAQAILNELAILSPQVFVECGGVSSTLYGILDCPLARINEALMSSLLFLLNDPKWRPACSQFHMIMAPFSDVHYRHYEVDSEISQGEEREIRIQSSCFAVLAAFRSWPGLITLYQPRDNTLRTLIDLLRLPNETTREVILDFLFDLLRIQTVESCTDPDQAVHERTTMKPPDPELWKLHEGFVVAEAKIMLPHIAKSRPNLIQNYFSLILYTLIKKDLLSSLCQVIVTASQELSVKATILLGELLHKVDQNMPNCGMMSHALPLLSEKAAGSDGEHRLKASQAITALLKLSRIRHDVNTTRGLSLYLKHIVEVNTLEDKANANTFTSGFDQSKLSKWLGKDHDDLIQQTMKESRVFTDSSCSWNWNLLILILRWPSSSFVTLEDNSYRSFIKKLLHYFKPSSKLFSRVEATHSSALVQAETLVMFTEFLLKVSNEDQEKFLGDLLADINAALKIVVCEMPSHDSYLSPNHLIMTVSQYYFLAIGNLTHSTRGYELVQKAGIYDHMMAVVEKSESDIYSKLFVTTLDYFIDGQNRVILNKILTSTKEGSRMYATQMLGVLVRVHARDFMKWGVELLVGQLYDKSKLVALVALDVLDEALDDEEYLEAVLENPPSVQHLGDNGQILLAKLVASPQGFRTYRDCNFIFTLMDKWANTFNLKYVKLMQIALAESLTHLQKGEDGLYGRRTGSKHLVHDVFVLPHLYGSLALHEEGFSLLVQHESLSNLVDTVREGNTSSMQEIFRLKAAIWALGHFGRSTNGVNFLNSENIISRFVDLAAKCPVYSVRGTVFHALCLIATTWDGANVLQKFGWESVRRHHHEQLQNCLVQENWSNEDLVAQVPKRTPTQHSESDLEEPEPVKAGFYFMDESEDETESLSLLTDDLDMDSAATRKSQTLPHDSKPPSYMGHQRSFSDCAPVMEELPGAPQLPSPQESSFSKRSSQLKNKILSSFKRKSSKRRDSVGSRTSTSSTSEKMFSFFHPSRRRKRGRSFGSSGKEDDFDSSHSQSCTDDELILDENNLSFETSSFSPRGVKLSPIASGASLSMVEAPISRREERKTSLREYYVPQGEKMNYLALSSPRHSSVTTYGLHKLRALALPRREGYKLRTLAVHRRGVSESSHEEMKSKNSLRDFLSSSYDQANHYSRNMIRSPSGCSELSSVRSFGALGPRGGSSNWLIGRAREGSFVPNLEDDPRLYSSAQCYMGFTIPVDIDRLLLDSSCLRSNEGSFPGMSESGMEWQEVEAKVGRKKSVTQRRIRNSINENEALEFHREETCLGCHSFSKSCGLLDSRLGDSEEKGLREASLLTKDAGVSNHSAATPPPKTNENSESRILSADPSKGPFQNRYLVRMEILKFVTNLSLPLPKAKSSAETGLLALKNRLSWAFQDPCLYAEICALLASYSFRLTTRRFIQELFLDLAFKEVFEEANTLLLSVEDTYRSLKPVDFGEDVREGTGELLHHDIPEYNINDFEGFDMEENG